MSSPPSADAKLSAITGWKVALVGAIATLVAAAIASGVAIWTTHESAKDALNTVNEQLAGETEKSRKEFLRDRQRLLYPKVVTAERALADAESEMIGVTDRYVEGGPKERKPSLKKLMANQSVLEHYDSSINIFGSTEIKPVFTAQIEHHDEYITDCGRVIDYLADARDPKTSAKHRKFYRSIVRHARVKMRRMLYVLYTDRSEFEKIARQDMGL